MAEAYPLQWPAGWQRTKSPKAARFDTSLANARDGLLDELRLMKAQYVVISSNVPLRKDGLPFSKYGALSDVGVAVYFQLEGEARCIPCDAWNRVEHNLQAIRKTVEALRGLERWGAKEMMHAAFRGFPALAAGDQWHEVLGVAPSADEAEINAAFRGKARSMHPDAGGTEEAFVRQIGRASCRERV